MNPDTRRRIANRLVAEQYDRPTPQDTPVVERGGIMPLATYGDGRTGLAWPEMIAGPANRFYQAATGQLTPGTDAFREAGAEVGMAAMTGGLLASRPANSVGTFAGRLAKTADHDALARAEDMAGRGVPREQIWTETGWFKAPDGRWKWEIDDSGAVSPLRDLSAEMTRALDRFDAAEAAGYATKDLQEIAAARADMSRARADMNNVQAAIDAGGNAVPKGRISGVLSHEALSAAYPWVPGVRVKPWPGAFWADGTVAAYSSGGWFRPETVYLSNRAGTSSILHEIQHGIQNREGFAQGGGGAGPYRDLAGEVEARAVQKRMDMTPAERRARPPWLDYDVPEGDQIVKFSNPSPAAGFGLLPQSGTSGVVNRLLESFGYQPPDWTRNLKPGDI